MAAAIDPIATVLVSACLLGIPCRWHGDKLRPSSYVRRWLREHPGAEIIPVCPEMAGGLPTPRPPVKRRKGHVYETHVKKILRKHITGRELTLEFHAGAQVALQVAMEHGCSEAILCKWSPSCDKTGITGKLLTRSGIKITNVF